jgi:hypothetical protein
VGTTDVNKIKCLCQKYEGVRCKYKEGTTAATSPPSPCPLATATGEAVVPCQSHRCWKQSLLHLLLVHLVLGMQKAAQGLHQLRYLRRRCC